MWGGEAGLGPMPAQVGSPLPHGARGCSFRRRVWGSLSHGIPERARMVPCVSVPPPRGPTSRVQPTLFCVLLRARRIGLELAGGGRGGRSEGSGDRGRHVCCPPAPRAPAPPDARGGPSKAPAPRLSPLAMRSPRFLSLGPRLCFYSLLPAGSLAGTSKLDSPPETDPRRSDPRPRPRTAGSVWVSVKQAQTHRGVSGGSASDRCAPSRLE